MTPPAIVSVLPIAVFLAITGLQLALALAALVVELRDGLKPSWTRAGAVALVFAVAVVVAMRARGVPVVELPPVVVAPGEDPAQAKEIEALRESVRQAQETFAKKSAELAELTEDHAPPDPVNVVTLLGLLAAAGLGGLLKLGDARTLLLGWRLPQKGEKDRRAQSLEELDRLADAASEGRFQDGLGLASQVDAALLKQKDQSDLTLLRALCAFHVASKRSSVAARKEVLEKPVAELRALVERAPRLHAAGYLLAMGDVLLGEHGQALAGLRSVERGLSRLELPFAENQSYCLLALAQERLAQGDTEAAGKYFAEATALGKLTDRIPILLVEGQVQGLRRSIAANHLEEAKKGVEALRKVEGLPQDQARILETVGDAFEVLIAFKQADDARALELVQGLLARIVPADLPPATDEAADEYLEPAVKVSALLFPPELYRAMYFMEAVVRVRLAAARRRPLTQAEAEEIALPLLRALQFEPRHREALAALGALAYWCIPGKRTKGLEWLEAAVSLGTRSPTALRLVDQERAREEHRQDLMHHFIGVSGRFLSDSTVTSQIRRALLEELGRFQDFAPVLLEIDQMVESEQQAPTVQSLGERSRYLETLLEDALGHQDLNLADQLSPLREEYRRCLEALEGAAARITQLDRRVLSDLGKLILT